MHTYSADFVSFSEGHASHIRRALWTYHSARLSYWVSVKSGLSDEGPPPHPPLSASGSLEGVVDMCAIRSRVLLTRCLCFPSSLGTVVVAHLYERRGAYASGWLLFLKCISWKTTCTYNPGEDFTQAVARERMFINEDCIKEEGEHLCFIKQGSQWIRVEVGLILE